MQILLFRHEIKTTPYLLFYVYIVHISVSNTFYSSCIGVFVNFNFMVPENLFLPSMTQLPVSENLNLGLRHSGFNALDDACRHLP